MTGPLFAVLLMMQDSDSPPVCPGGNTISINHCAHLDVEAAQKRMHRYLLAATTRAEENDDGMAALIRASQTSWEAYAQNECAALYEYWKSGTIRGLMAADCSKALIDQRTHVIWQNWLTYPDSTPPILPEPSPTPNSNALDDKN